MDMLHALVSGFLQCFNLSTFNLMMIGIAIGFVVGILPGPRRSDGHGSNAALCIQNVRC